MFYTELAEKQAAALKANHTPAGTIDLIVAYLKDKEAVEVAVVQAKDLPKVAKNGTMKEATYTVTSDYCYTDICSQDLVILWLNWLLFLMSYSLNAPICSSKQSHKSKL